MVQELQATDNNPLSDEGWKFEKSVTTVYICCRCCYTFTNKVNFGRKLENGKVNEANSGI